MVLDMMTTNGITTAAELVAVLILFALLGWVLRRGVDWVSNSEALSRFESAAETVRANLKLLVRLGGLVGLLAVGGADGWFWWKGEMLHTMQLEALRQIPPSFWIGLAVAAGKVLALALATRWLLVRVRRLLAQLSERAKAYEGIRANDASIQAFFEVADKTAVRLGWLGVIAIAISLVGGPSPVLDGAVKLWGVLAIVSVAVLVWRGLDAATRSSSRCGCVAWRASVSPR